MTIESARLIAASELEVAAQVARSWRGTETVARLHEATARRIRDGRGDGHKRVVELMRTAHNTTQSGEEG